ncbi:MAG TPA: DNA-directed RNA polymerase subunit omega [Terriglobales bacterium]
MRSDKVFEALHTLQNRYMLCQIASKATRKFHKPNTRVEDTTNEILNRISDSVRDEVLAEPVNVNEAQRRAA